MKEAIGYVTDDGTFFESAEEAEEWESWKAMHHGLCEVGSIDADVFMNVIATIPSEIRRYINANEAASRYREIQASIGKEDNSLREDNTQAIFEQSTRINEPLPDMGSSVIKEKVRLERTIDGIGSRGIDASDVRSSQDMAVGTHTKSAKARLNSSTSHIRQSKVGQNPQAV